MPKETVLILDKENHTLWTLKTLLETEKYIAIAVNTIDRALKNFSEFEVSAFITEYRIDHSNTIETIRELKKRFPELYVMMLTNEDVGEREYEKILNAGVDDYFLKASSSRKILFHLKKGLRQRRIFLQKKRMEQELNQIKTKGKILGVTPVGEELLVNES
jgi:DNA-binding response OmpR family regulator